MTILITYNSSPNSHTLDAADSLKFTPNTSTSIGDKYMAQKHFFKP